MIQNILITGKPGCGKSTLVQKLRGCFKDRIISGIITPEIKKGGKRYGFKIIDLLSEKEEILSSVDIQSPHRVSKYHVDIKAIDRIMDEFIRNSETADILMVDEIGKMELYSDKFKQVIQRVLDSEKPVIATITLSQNPFIDTIKNRSDSKVLYLEKGNQESILNKIKADVMLFFD
ncbi:MAG: NTPase [Candidatus Aminicenantes bacterium]|nr:NTPase [Candidatus Aminicenantes bacterium]